LLRVAYVQARAPREEKPSRRVAKRLQRSMALSLPGVAYLQARAPREEKVKMFPALSPDAQKDP